MSKYTYQYFLRKKIFENSSSLESFLDANGFVMYFKMDESYYATGEEGRMAFARLKNPDEDTPEGWAEEADFSAYDLDKLVQGNPEIMRLFDQDDLKKIKVVDRKEVVEKYDGKFKPKHRLITIADIDKYIPKNVDEQ